MKKQRPITIDVPARHCPARRDTTQKIDEKDLRKSRGPKIERSKAPAAVNAVSRIWPEVACY
jgi:hypothetical protein